MPNLVDYLTPIRSGLGHPMPAAAALSAARARRLRQDLDALAAHRCRALVESQQYPVTGGTTGE